MKQNQKVLLIIGLSTAILLNVLFLCWLLIDAFSDSNESEEAVVATDSGEETTCEEITLSEEITSQEAMTKESTTEEEISEKPTTVEPTPEETIGERIKVEIPFSEIEKVLVRKFSWGDFKTQLGYSHSDFHSVHPMNFMVGENVIGVVDSANHRIMIHYKGQYHQISLSELYTKGYWIKMSQLDSWITVWNYYEDKLMLYWPESGVKLQLDLFDVLENHQDISEFLEIGSSYIVWAEPSGDKEAVYRYDWIEHNVEFVTLQEKSATAVSVGGVLTDVVGTYEDNVYYCQYGEKVDRYILNRETQRYHLYTEIAFAPYLTSPLLYLSPDGNLYIMEMFEEGAEISEIKLAIGEENFDEEN